MIATNITPGMILPNYDADLCAIGNLYLKVLEAVNSYVFPKRKALDVTVDQEITEHRAPTEAQIEMLKQIAEKLGWEFHPKEPAKLAGPIIVESQDSSSSSDIGTNTQA